MAKKADMDMQKLGSYAFLFGVVIAVVAGIAAAFTGQVGGAAISLILVILGIIVGFLNINDKETVPFLVCAIALMTMGAGSYFLVIDNIIKGLGTLIALIVSNIAVFVSPAAVIVALKGIYSLAKQPTM